MVPRRFCSVFLDLPSLYAESTIFCQVARLVSYDGEHIQTHVRFPLDIIAFAGRDLNMVQPVADHLPAPAVRLLAFQEPQVRFLIALYLTSSAALRTDKRLPEPVIVLDADLPARR